MYRTILISMAMLFSSSAYAETKDDKVFDSAFGVVAGSLIVSSVFDVETTALALRHGGRELNPVLRPFVHSGKTANYVVLGAVNTGALYVAYRMKRSANPAVRKIWWVFPVAMVVSHGVAGSINIRAISH